MSTKAVVEFYDKVVRDKELREKLEIVNENTINEKLFEDLILPEAKKLGYDFSYDDILDYYHPKEKVELSIDEMESVSGGGGCCKKEDPYKEINTNLSYANNCSSYKGGDPSGRRTCATCGHSKNKDGIYYCKHF